MEINKQSSVEWLVEQYIKGNYEPEIYEQAKAMHKEEMIEFAQWMYDYKGDINKVEELFEQFKKK